MKGTHFLSWEIKLAANVITNQPIMKQSGTLVSIRLGLISPGMLWSHGCNLSQGALFPLSLWSCQVKGLPHSLSCLPIMFHFLKSSVVFSRLPLAWASLPKTKPAYHHIPEGERKQMTNDPATQHIWLPHSQKTTSVSRDGRNGGCLQRPYLSLSDWSLGGCAALCYLRKGSSLSSIHFW